MDGAKIDEAHRKELLRFLLVKTAAVRRGVKPAELLRVRHCYSCVNSEGLRVCLYRSDIYCILGLDYVELKVEETSSLVLFHNPPVLAATLAERRNRRWLARLDQVKGRFAGKKVAVFGLGDSASFADTFCVAAETIATAAKDAGATLVGEVLKLDDTNEADKTDGKVAAWVSTIKAAI